MYIAKHFTIEELVYPELYSYWEQKGMQWVLWRMFDIKFLQVIDRLREFLGPCFINTWHKKYELAREKYFGGKRWQYCGIRPPIIELDDDKYFLCYPTETILHKKNPWGMGTTHTQGNTGDLHFVYHSPLEAFQLILKHSNLFPEIKIMESIELTPGWNHISTANYADNDKLRIIG